MRRCGRRASPPPLPPAGTKWTRRVPHPVLIGHAASPQAGKDAGEGGWAWADEGGDRGSDAEGAAGDADWAIEGHEMGELSSDDEGQQVRGRARRHAGGCAGLKRAGRFAGGDGVQARRAAAWTRRPLREINMQQPRPRWS